MPWKRIDNQKVREAIFEFLVRYKKLHDGNTPSTREIMDACGIRSSSHVHFHVDVLAQMGRLRKISGFRQLEIVGGDWKWHEEFVDPLPLPK